MRIRYMVGSAVQRVSNAYKMLTDKDFKNRMAFAKLAFQNYDRAIFGIITSTEYCGRNPYGDEEMVASKFRVSYIDKKSLKPVSIPLRPISCEDGGTRPAQYPGGGGMWKRRDLLKHNINFESKLEVVAYGLQLEGVHND